MDKKSKFTTIQLSPETRNKLRDLGKKGETYEDIILRLLKNPKR
jgi:predicted DNA-binding protein